MAEKVLNMSKEPFIKYDDMSRDFGMSDAHYHNFYEVYYMVNGKCRFSVENHIYTLNKYDMLIIPPGLIHKADDYPQMSNRIILHFPKNALNIELKKRLDTFRNNSFYTPRDHSHIHNLLKKMHAELKSDDSISDAMSFCYLALLVEYIVRNESFAKQSTVQNPSLQLTEDIMDYIIKNFNRDISVTDISSHFGYTPSYISTLFKTSSGIGIKEFITLQRIKNAEYMLAKSDKPITQIATECGFDDSNYFSTVFRKTHAISPREYRSIHFQD